MSVAPSGITIGRLEVRSADARATREVVREIQSIHWPVPEGERWLILRRVDVSGRPSDLGKRATEAVMHRLPGSVWGGSPAAAHADSVWFASLAELLARLSLDLARGARGRWWWQHWAGLFDLRSGHSLARLWSEHIAELPTVVAELGRSGDLAAVWRCLDAPDVRALIAALSQHTRTLLPAALPARSASDLPAKPLPVAVRRQWQAALRDLPETDHRRWLAAIVTGMELGAIVSAEGAAQQLSAISAALPGLGPQEERSSRAPGAQRPGRVDPSEAQKALAQADRLASVRSEAIGLRPVPPAPAEAERTADGAAEPGLSKPISIPEPAAPDRAHRAAAHLEIAPGSPKQRTVGAPLGPPADGDGPATAAQATPDAAPPVEGKGRTPSAIEAPQTQYAEAFHTGFGGVFYLVNLLSFPPLYTLLRRSRGWGEPLAGWSWLSRTACHLDLDLSDRLGAFLAQQLDLAKAADLAQLDPLPSALIAAARRAAAELWTPELIKVPALMRHTPSHVDLHFPASAVRLEVRLAGLDLNPGWVPWLGRVVAFHYDTGSEHG